ncbi:MmpS family transport accessory protein [Mycobacterium kiyosense]|uniref:MmpS family transport accessory protein n=1 Tax=Mycobacterium kiyosense TaxID=2871094 RepID=UPI001F2CF36B|nr:MmpS family transport accessory protein [Mycobacterium kiyosense]BDB41228.1 putative transport accessory protein MmpS1 [Mycobacterium kiyosense]GLB96707.1 putative transport accessory protein MmpS1 [Mycobacterium kiyosense]GLD08558.1 putative transport accessory protein MmpS1 [Mycobacterium kiyosense]GLD13731.1 putative transport accessory protein MmpS1 [Mycobacterium kiyosense]GLD19675.1 putative transport accessory protein MmpS1 [Mycobacterium kiyosense]
MTGLVKRIWLPIVMVVVVAVGSFTVSRLREVFGSDQHVSSGSNADAIVAFNPKRVVYEIFGPTGATATIHYLDADAQPQEVDNVAIPWSVRIETTLSAVVANVVAQGDSERLGCRITVNGVVRDELTVESHNAATSCLVKSA